MDSVDGRRLSPRGSFFRCADGATATFAQGGKVPHVACDDRLDDFTVRQHRTRKRHHRLLEGQYSNPVRAVGFTAEGWSRDVSETWHTSCGGVCPA